MAGLKKLEGKEYCFDIIFMDPPYNQEWERRVLEYLQSSSLLNDETLIIVEASLKTDISYIKDIGFEIVKIKEYKTNKHIFLRQYALI